MDVLLQESGDGGELTKNQTDLSVVFGFENMPYIALFGGNIEQSTPDTRLANEQAFDFWGNVLLMDQNQSIQFNSLTERLLNTVVLNSAGRQKIQNAVDQDLAFMADFANVTVEVSIIDDNVVLIAIRIVKPDNLQKQDYVYIWNATISELSQVGFQTITPAQIRVRYFDLFFDIFFA